MRYNEGGTTAGVRTALRRFRDEVRRFGWQLLVVGSGLWHEAAGCVERFVVDYAAALEQQRPRVDRERAGLWGSCLIPGIEGRIIRMVRGCEPWASTCRRLAVRIDDALLARRNRSASEDGQAGV